MEQIISSGISANDILTWIAIAFIVYFFVEKLVGKFYPGVKSRWEREKQIDDTDEELTKRVEKLEKTVDELVTKSKNDFRDIKNTSERINKIEQTQKDMMYELELLVRASLATLKGLHEVGANGPTSTAQEEIENYLASKAHKTT